MSAHPIEAPLLAVRDLAITHEGNEHPAPAGVSFDVRAGETVLLLGPSGSGKSTLALALNGLIPHDIPALVTGSVHVQGLDTATSAPAALSPHIAMVFQDPDAQLVTATLLDEVCFGPENLRLPVEEVLRRAERSLRSVGLWERRTENPDALSGGGRQRLAIACALAMGAPVLVLDEPTANLDPAGIIEVYAVLRELCAEPGRAIILIEHNLDDAVEIATRVIALDALGAVAVDGTPAQVFRENAERLEAIGVWLPTATHAALELQHTGRWSGPLPLTPAQLRAGLPDIGMVPRTTPPPPALDAAITVQDLTVERGRTRALDSISLTVPRGSFTAIVGGNGAGKTTLAQAIAGVVTPPRNTVSIGGLDPARARLRELTARVGFVFQNPEHQFIAPTVRDELTASLRSTRLGPQAIEERTTELLTRFGLLERAALHPFLLSGGQKRRLSVGTALMAAADILVLDEPTFGQDQARAKELVGLLQELNEAGTTIVVVTHDMQLVASEATHVIALERGRLLATGSPRDVLADPEIVRRAGLRAPALVRALAGAPGYDGVWTMTDLLHATGVRS